jgi:hypothetical protein
MGIFKNITKTLKKAAPLIGSAIGMYYGGSFGAALGSGIGSLASGRSAEEALKNAALTGAASYALGGKDFGKDFDFKKYGTSGSPLRTMFQGAETSVPSGGVKQVADKSFLSKLIPESTMGKVALAGGISALASGLGEKEQTEGFQERSYPKGQMRAGMGMVDGISFNLNDDEERAEYFRRVREKQGFKDKEDEDEDEVSTDPVRAFRGGYFPSAGMQQQMGSSGLQQFGQQIGKNIQDPVAERLQEIPSFLNEVESMAEERFGVELGGTNQTGGGLNQIGGNLPSFNTNMAHIFEQMKNRTGQDNTIQDQEFSPMGDVIREAPLMGFGGSPINSNTSTTTGNLGLLSDAFNQGVSGGSGPFGGGTARIGGMGAMGSLFMNNGGEVTGPGTGTSDSVPARLSDGEFVVTSKAVRGAGGGDRDLGAARMYDMMSQLERIA